MRLLMSLALCAFLNGCTSDPERADLSYTYDNVHHILTVKEIPLSYRLDIPEDISKTVPLLVVIDGSSCRGPGTNGLIDLLKPDANSPLPYARLIVEKIGVELEDDGETCSDLFSQNYTIQNRVLNHLRVLQHLRGEQKWWNGELLIWGWSDGGDIAAQLTAYYPNTQRAVLGAMGGGITMAEHFRDQDFCPADRFQSSEQKESCIAKLQARFDDIRTNPSSAKTWLGDDNTYRVWESRLFSRLSHLLVDNQVPILIVHGKEDKGQIKGARALKKDLEAGGNTVYTYWEIENMGHSPRQLTAEQGNRLYMAMRDWLLTGETLKPDMEGLD